MPDRCANRSTLRHYDVIVYDALESPVLWATANPDISSQGRARAIPAEHIRALFEVKAAFKKPSIKEAREKLAELNAYQAHLPERFVCGMVFFEIREDQQKPSNLGGELLIDDVVGYFGGLILRAEGLDANISGYFTLLHDSETELDESMPLVREISHVARNLDGTLTLGGKGVFASAVAMDDMWNFDVGYSPRIPGVHLAWAYNSFPQFCLDLLERMEGRYDPKGLRRSLYGMSFIR